MSRQISSTISFVSEEGYKNVIDAFEKNNWEELYALSDISLLDEYLNIIFDCDEGSCDAIMKNLILMFPDTYWRLTKNDGEVILSISSFDNNGLSCEQINKTLDDIAKDSTYACGASCDDCDRDCNEKPSRSEADNIDIQRLCAMVEELANSPYEEEYFYTIGRAYRIEIERHMYAQFKDNEEADESSDIMLDAMLSLLAKMALVDGSYTQKEQDCIANVMTIFPYESVHERLEYVTGDLTYQLGTMKFWREMERVIDCKIRELFLIMCIYVGLCDGPLNDKELGFIKELERI